jgi:hypothetical protein
MIRFCLLHICSWHKIVSSMLFWGRNVFVLPNLGPLCHCLKHPEPEPYFIPSKNRNLHHDILYSVKQVRIKVQWALIVQRINFYNHWPLRNCNINMNRHVTELTLLGLKRLVAGFPPRGPGFKTGSSHVKFVVDKLTLGQVFSKYFGFPCQSLFHQFIHNHHHLSSEAGTINQ